MENKSAPAENFFGRALKNPSGNFTLIALANLSPVATALSKGWLALPLLPALKPLAPVVQAQPMEFAVTVAAVEPVFQTQTNLCDAGCFANGPE
jgi:hypothetical protein